jgi:hypothetical protein
LLLRRPFGRSPRTRSSLNRFKYELVINLKTAKTLGLTIPQLLLASAVIE